MGSLRAREVATACGFRAARAPPAASKHPGCPTSIGRTSGPPKVCTPWGRALVRGSNPSDKAAPHGRLQPGVSSVAACIAQPPELSTDFFRFSEGSGRPQTLASCSQPDKPFTHPGHQVDPRVAGAQRKLDSPQRGQREHLRRTTAASCCAGSSHAPCSNEMREQRLLPKLHLGQGSL